MGKSIFELINELIVAISHLLWPIIAIVILFMFNKEITEILKRLKKGKFFGQELELSEKVDKLEKSVRKAVTENPEKLEDASSLDDQLDILEISAHDPKIGIIKLAIEIEKEIKKISGCLGIIRDKNDKTSVLQAFELLIRRGSLPKHTKESVEIFWRLRNEIVHGKQVDNDSNIIRVLDIGLTLLKTLKAIPHEKNIVYHPGVDVFSDSDCSIQIKGVRGLILETHGPGGIEKDYRIFPTTKTDYIKGKQVTWEWNFNRSWGQCWYIDPDTKEKKSSWNSSVEFIGRHIDDL